ncbi:Uma2 family endonuclease [Streptomyces sp. LX-29]|uniref:Uma2 family endonuclease n=1 Tax=Streptomyces sp. LX-29 TaxID=2900152 RepID=UPI00240D086C|nr:Uma2 family endonuclease [Streptomyces sp. LX-29]WFB09690.1 Uma2 family endonuclease [Streptomyces sp. LX-29]
MTTMLDFPPPTITTPGAASFAQLCEALEAMNEHVPAGFSAEIIGGKIVLSPWSKPSYQAPMLSLRDQLRPRLPVGSNVDTSPFLFVFADAERAYGPDVHVTEAAAFASVSEGIRIPGEALSLVAELTSASTRDIDYQDKLAVYGRHVPVYLLLDMQERVLTVFSGPSEWGYTTRTPCKFGDKVHIPAPFDFELDTAGWEA